MPDSAAGGGHGLKRAETIGEAVRRVAQAFKQVGLDTPELDARILVAEGAGLPRATLLAAPELTLEAAASRVIASYQARRLAREPVSRIIGRREFRGLMLELGEATLDPRPETETIVETALGLVQEAAVPGGSTLRILDLGTGSGAILIAILAELTEASGIGTDIVPAAIEVARRNAQRHGVADRADFLCTNWHRDVPGHFDLVVSNPPYIAAAHIATLEPEVGHYDPTAALDGGEDGLDAYRAILGGLHRVLNPAGWILFEVSPADAEAVVQLCREQGFAPDGIRPWFYRDLAGRPRCVAIKARQ